MTVIRFVSLSQPTLVSYQWVEYTPQDLANCQAAPDSVAWMEANATVTQTVQVP